MSPAPGYELLAIDVDGTLLDSRHRLPEANRAALHRAHEAGWRIVLCTGRSYPETRPILDALGLDLDAVVTVFGALISEARTGRTLARVTMPLPTAYRLTDWFLDAGFAVLWLTDREQVGFDGYVIDGPRRHPAVDRWVEQTPCQVRCVGRLDAAAASPLRVSIIDEPEVLAGVAEKLGLEFDGRIAYNLLRAPAYDLTIIEAFAPGVDKWQGVLKLCETWGIDPACTVAVGDDVNDLAMIKNAGLGVAVANAAPAVRDAARRVIGDHDSAAVAGLIQELLQETGAARC